MKVGDAVVCIKNYEDNAGMFNITPKIGHTDIVIETTDHGMKLKHHKHIDGSDIWFSKSWWKVIKDRDKLALNINLKYIK